MEYYKYLDLAVAVCAIIGFIYGLVVKTKIRRALYYKMIVAAVGTMALGRLYEFVYMWVSEEQFERFQIGTLVVIATFLFFFTANYGTMDHLGDNGSKEFRKYRIIAAAAPIIITASYVPVYLSDSNLITKISYAAIWISIMIASYYALKHLILPDVDFGVIRCIRGYNLLVLCYGLLSVTERIALLYDAKIVTWITCILSAVVALLLIPVLKKGAAKWII